MQSKSTAAKCTTRDITSLEAPQDFSDLMRKTMNLIVDPSLRILKMT